MTRMKLAIKWMKSLFKITFHEAHSEPPKTGLCCKCGKPIDVSASFPDFLCDECW